MAKWILFETTDSVIEILWDVALAFFVVRLALLYASLVFGSVFSLILLVRYFLPSLTSTFAAHPPPPPLAASSGLVLTEHAQWLPLLTLAASAVWAKVVMARCEVPRVLGFRLAVGATAAAMVGVVEGVVGLVEYEVLGGAGMAGAMGGWATGVGVMALFALMPVLVMGAEKRREGGEAALGLGMGRGREKEGM